MASAEGDIERVSVSRDALRADLADLELRIRTFLTDQLEKKADVSDLAALAARVQVLQNSAGLVGPRQIESLDAWNRGELNESQKRAVRHVADEVAEGRSSGSWQTWGRWAAAVVAVVSILSIVFGIAFSIYQAGQ